MNKGTSQVFEIKDNADFKKRVLEAPADKTVVVDFWAEWCAPCKALGPMLERVVTKLGVDICLAKVNVDKNPGLSDAFQISGIPDVKVFREGMVIEEFTGALAEPELKKRLSSLTPSPADKLVVQARKLVSEGDFEKAERALREALAEDKAHPRARLRLAELMLARGNPKEAGKLAKDIGEQEGEYQAAKAVLCMVGFAEECVKAKGLSGSKKKLKAKPKDPAARYSLACCLAASGDYAAALEEFLKIVESKKDFRDDVAREAMVHIFALLGADNPITVEYRKKLSKVLY